MNHTLQFLLHFITTTAKSIKFYFYVQFLSTYNYCMMNIERNEYLKIQ